MRLILSIALVLLFCNMTYADDNKSLKPHIAKGKGEQCVAETDFMRRNHMDLLKHDRDLTMYQGLRDIDFSLNGCIECHTVNDSKGQALSVTDERHFCRSCHDFAAVKVDCFQCHASRPELKKEQMPIDKNHEKLTQKVTKP